MGCQFDRALLELSDELTVFSALNFRRIENKPEKWIECVCRHPFGRSSERLSYSNRWGRIKVQVCAGSMGVKNRHWFIGLRNSQLESSGFRTSGIEVAAVHFPAFQFEEDRSPHESLDSAKNLGMPRIVEMVYTIVRTMNIRLIIQCSIEAAFLCTVAKELDFVVDTLGSIKPRGISRLHGEIQRTRMMMTATPPMGQATIRLS